MIWLQEHWQQLCEKASLNDENGRVYEELIQSYSEPHRVFHTLDHLVNVLCAIRRLEPVAIKEAKQRGKKLNLDVVEVAAWFHDVVYAIGRGDNEARSADFAEKRLYSMGADPKTFFSSYGLIRVTEKHKPYKNDIEAILLCDADFSGLALPAEDYIVTAKNIR